MNTQENSRLFHTTNLKAATALATMGFKPHQPPVTRIVREDGKESVVFWFEAQNDKGENASSVYRGMTKEADVLNEKDPENVINYLRSYAANRDVYVEIIRNTPRYVELESNGKRISIREDATDEQREAILAKL